MTSNGPPKRGSLRESVLFYLVLKKEDIETSKTKVIVQALAEAAPKEGRESIQKAWKEFIQDVYPWAETAKKREVGEWAQRLAQEVARGPLAVFAQPDKSFRSRLKAKVVERDQLSPKAREIVSKVFKKLPNIVPKNT